MGRLAWVQGTMHQRGLQMPPQKGAFLVVSSPFKSIGMVLDAIWRAASCGKCEVPGIDNSM